MKTIKQLQGIVNEISKELGGIDTPEKLRKAQQMSRERVSETFLTEIMDEALTIRWNSDTRQSVESFMENVIRNSRQSQKARKLADCI